MRAEGDELKTLVEKAASTLGYLKIITPRSKQSEKQTGSVKIVYEVADGSKRSRTGQTPVHKVMSNWTGSNMDPDQVSRHNRSLKRAGFKNNSDAKGIF